LEPGKLFIWVDAFGIGKPDVLLRTGVCNWMPPFPAIIGNEAREAHEIIDSRELQGKIILKL
tara:strand:- start:1405 stop:1590 length:186 start_codon:yes stop_codon:yes gene_type:complete